MNAPRVLAPVLPPAPPPVDLVIGNESGSVPAARLHGVTALPELALLQVSGPEAADFLQTQLTQDVKTLEPGQIRLAGYCTPKGRLLATFQVWVTDNEPDTVWLACSRDIAARVAKRLAMFVMRAKAKVSDVSDRLTLLGWVTDQAGSLPATVARMTPVTLVVPPPPSADGQAAGPGDGATLAVARGIAAVSHDQVDATVAGQQQAGYPPLPHPFWARLEILSGEARISATSQELFVPQMVNYERVDGVHFRKGCYPGQEVVARSQYLGKLKRRMFIGIGIGEPPAPGVDVHAEGADAKAEPIGQVVLATAAARAGQYLVQFESRVDAIAGDTASAARIAGQPVRLLALPYSLE